MRDRAQPPALAALASLERGKRIYLSFCVGCHGEVGDGMGKAAPYMGTETWIDGTLKGDVPMRRLSRLHNVNHFIVSQVNPHVFPFVTDTRRGSDPVSIMKTAGSRTVREWLNAGATLLEKPLSWNPTLNRITNAGLSIINQDYVGDINILPDKLVFNPLKLLAHRSAEEVVELIALGERVGVPQSHISKIERGSDGSWMNAS